MTLDSALNKWAQESNRRHKAKADQREVSDKDLLFSENNSQDINYDHDKTLDPRERLFGDNEPITEKAMSIDQLIPERELTPYNKDLHEIRMSVLKSMLNVRPVKDDISRMPEGPEKEKAIKDNLEKFKKYYKLLEESKQKTDKTTSLKGKKEPHVHTAIILHGNSTPASAFYNLSDPSSSHDKMVIIDENGNQLTEPVPVQQIADVLGDKYKLEQLDRGIMNITDSSVPETFYSIVEDGQDKAIYAFEGIYDYKPDKDGTFSIATIMGADERSFRETEYNISEGRIQETSWTEHNHYSHEDIDMEEEEEITHTSYWE